MPGVCWSWVPVSRATGRIAPSTTRLSNSRRSQSWRACVGTARSAPCARSASVGARGANAAEPSGKRTRARSERQPVEHAPPLLLREVLSQPDELGLAERRRGVGAGEGALGVEPAAGAHQEAGRLEHPVEVDVDRHLGGELGVEAVVGDDQPARLRGRRRDHRRERGVEGAVSVEHRLGRGRRGGAGRRSAGEQLGLEGMPLPVADHVGRAEVGEHEIERLAHRLDGGEGDDPVVELAGAVASERGSRLLRRRDPTLEVGGTFGGRDLVREPEAGAVGEHERARHRLRRPGRPPAEHGAPALHPREQVPERRPAARGGGDRKVALR